MRRTLPPPLPPPPATDWAAIVAVIEGVSSPVPAASAATCAMSQLQDSHPLPLHCLFCTDHYSHSLSNTHTRPAGSHSIALTSSYFLGPERGPFARLAASQPNNAQTIFTTIITTHSSIHSFSLMNSVSPSIHIFFVIFFTTPTTLVTR